MFLWLVIAAVLLAGLLLSFETGSSVLAGVPNAAIALAVVALLVLLYLAATRISGPGDSKNRRGIVAAIVVALLAGSLTLAAGRVDIANLIDRARQDGENGASRAAVGLKSLLIRRNEQGQFLARGEINGQPAEFIVDTGATAVLIRTSDATKAGLATEGLDYAVPITTANGAALAAPVRLRVLAIGPIHLENVEALVAQPGSLNESLLGMSFLTRLRSYELKGNYMTLRE